MEFSLEPRTVFEGLLAVGMAVAAFIYRLHVGQYKRDQLAHAATVKRLEQADTKSEQKLESLQTESKSEMEKKFNELRQDLYGRLLEEAEHRKEVFQALQTNSSEFWKGLNAMKDGHHAFETSVLRAYHTKDELSRLLDDKIGPVVEQIRHLQQQVTNGNKRP